jgi:hypothetical protein
LKLQISWQIHPNAIVPMQCSYLKFMCTMLNINKQSHVTTSW